MEVMVKVVVEEGKVMVRLVVVELLRLVIEKVMVEKPRWALLLSILRRSYHLKDKSQLLSSTKCFMIQLLLTSLASLPTNHTHTDTLSSSTLEYFLSLRPKSVPQFYCLCSHYSSSLSSHQIYSFSVFSIQVKCHWHFFYEEFPDPQGKVSFHS